MTARVWFRCLGVILGAASLTWCGLRAIDVWSVTVVHWPLLIPRLVLEGVPAALGGAAGIALWLERDVARPMVAMFSITLAYALAMATVNPEIVSRYTDVLRQQTDTDTWLHSDW